MCNQFSTRPLIGSGSAAADVANNRRVSYLVGIAVRAADKNWPEGVVSVGPYLLARIAGYESFELPALVLTRTVSEFSRHMCEVRWSERLKQGSYPGPACLCGRELSFDRAGSPGIERLVRHRFWIHSWRRPKRHSPTSWQG